MLAGKASRSRGAGSPVLTCARASLASPVWPSRETRGDPSSRSRACTRHGLYSSGLCYY